jgi:hypothetical protein
VVFNDGTYEGKHPGYKELDYDLNDIDKHKYRVNHGKSLLREVYFGRNGLNYVVRYTG